MMKQSPQRRRISRSICLLMVIMLFAAGCAAPPVAQEGPEANNAVEGPGANYYIDSVNGDDASDGRSASTAWQRLTPLATLTLAAGDTVHVARGSVWSGIVLTIKQSGTADNPIALRSYGDGALPIFKNPNQLYALEVIGDYVVIDGLAFQDTTTIARWPAGYQDSGALLVRAGADHVSVTNSEFSAVGLGVKTYGSHTTITNNYFHDLTIAYRDDEQSYGAVGVSINNANATVAYNRFVNCRSTDSPYGADGGAIEIEGLAFAKNDIAIHHNVSSGSQGFLEVTETEANNVTLSYNLSDDYQQFIAFDTTTKPTTFRAEHNTVIRTHAQNAVAVFTVFYYRETVASPSDTWLTFRNNIFYTPAAKVLNGSFTHTAYNYPHDHNLYYDGTADPVGYPLGEGDLIADPQFVDFNARDLHVQATSPAVNSGANLGYTSDLDMHIVPVGAAPDKGAYEFKGSPQIMSSDD